MTKIDCKPLVHPVCETAAFYALDRFNMDPPMSAMLVIQWIESIRLESHNDELRGLFKDGRSSGYMAREEQIAELNRFLTKALQTLGMTQES